MPYRYGKCNLHLVVLTEFPPHGAIHGTLTDVNTRILCPLATQATLRRYGFVFILWCVVARDSATADAAIFVAHELDGTPLFSSQPYGPGFRAYLRDDAIAPRRATKSVTASGVGQLQRQVSAAIHEAAQEHGIDPALVNAIIAVESAYNPNAVSSKGAAGIMQLIPSTAAQYGISNPYDLRQSLSGGIRYLKDLLALYNGNLVLAIAAYNAGQGNVLRHNNRIPPFRETMLYVPNVLAKIADHRRQDLCACQ
jgi:soluble lytic murein transglycosylase-like protein